MKKMSLATISLIAAMAWSAAAQTPQERNIQKVISNASLLLHGGSLSPFNSFAAPEATGAPVKDDQCKPDCHVPDPLAPYRQKFNDARPLKLSDIPDKELLLVNTEEAPGSDFPVWSGSMIYFDLKGLFPKAAVYVFFRGTICEVASPPIGCSLKDASDYETYILIAEGNELRSYSSPSSKYGSGYRWTYHIKDDYIFAKEERCDDGKTWKEVGYLFASVTKHRRS